MKSLEEKVIDKVIELFAPYTHEDVDRLKTEIGKLFSSEKEDEKIKTASRFLCEDDEFSIADQVKLIEAQADIDDSVMLDHVDNVTVWEAVEYSFTVSKFLDEINY